MTVQFKNFLVLPFRWCCCMFLLHHTSQIFSLMQRENIDDTTTVSCLVWLMSSSLWDTGWRPSAADDLGSGMSVVLHRGSTCPLSRAVDGCIPCSSTISSCQSAATSKIVKRCYSLVFSRNQRYIKYPDLYLYLYLWVGGGSWPQSTAETTTYIEGQMSWWSWWRWVPAWGMHSEEEDAVPSHRRLRSVDTPETVVAWYGEDRWTKVGCGLSSVGWHRDGDGFSISRVSSWTDDWYLPCSAVSDRAWIA